MSIERMATTEFQEDPRAGYELLLILQDESYPESGRLEVVNGYTIRQVQGIHTLEMDNPDRNLRAGECLMDVEVSSADGELHSARLRFNATASKRFKPQLEIDKD